jgi:hypothetical protein
MSRRDIWTRVWSPPPSSLPTHHSQLVLSYLRTYNFNGGSIDSAADLCSEDVRFEFRPRNLRVFLVYADIPGNRRGSTSKWTTITSFYIYLTHYIQIIIPFIFQNSFKQLTSFCSTFLSFKRNFLSLNAPWQQRKAQITGQLLRINWSSYNFVFTNPWQL